MNQVKALVMVDFFADPDDGSYGNIVVIHESETNPAFTVGSLMSDLCTSFTDRLAFPEPPSKKGLFLFVGESSSEMEISGEYVPARVGDLDDFGIRLLD